MLPDVVLFFFIPLFKAFLDLRMAISWQFWKNLGHFLFGNRVRSVPPLPAVSRGRMCRRPSRRAPCSPVPPIPSCALFRSLLSDLSLGLSLAVIFSARNSLFTCRVIILANVFFSPKISFFYTVPFCGEILNLVFYLFEHHYFKVR